MAYTTPLFDGNAIFGLAVRVVQEPVPIEVQRSTYFGLAGAKSLYGGSRGRMFQVTGLLQGNDPDGLVAAENAIRNYADGFKYQFKDTFGRVYDQVMFHGDIKMDPRGPGYDCQTGGWIIAYALTLIGLI